jgi:hypothetical protein
VVHIQSDALRYSDAHRGKGPARAHERTVLGKGIWALVLVSQAINDRTPLRERNAVCPPALPEQAGLEELSPGDRAPTSGFKPDHRTVVPVPVGAAIEHQCTLD